MFDERMVLAGNPSGHGGGVGRGHLVVEGDAVGCGGMVHAVEAPHEVEMPPAAAEFAVGDHMQAGGLLLGDEFGDGLVLDRLERCGIDFAGGEILTRGLELGRAEIGADHVGAERRVMRVCH